MKQAHVSASSSQPRTRWTSTTARSATRGSGGSIVLCFAARLAVGAVAVLGCSRNPSPSDGAADPGPPKLKPADAGPCPQPYCPEIVYDRVGDVSRPRRGIEVEGPTIYWCEVSNVEGNVVRAAPKDGSGPIRTLGQWFDFAFNRSLVLDETHLYWLMPDDSRTQPQLVRVDRDGGNSTTTSIPTAGNGAKLSDFGPIAGTPDAVLLATFSCNTILRVPKDGSAIQSWTVSPYGGGGGVTGLEQFGDFIYCSNGSHIHRLDPATGAVSEMVSGQTLAGPMALINESLYFVNNDGDASPDSKDNVARVSAAGGAAENLGPAFGSAARLLYDAPRHTIHWVTGLNFQTAKLVAYDVNASAEPVLVLNGQNVMGDSASDADYVYWLSDYAVTRLHKWP
jgi:hypothetical protein